MRGFRLVIAAIVAGLIVISAAAWFLYRAPSSQQPAAASSDVPPLSPRANLEGAMARWLLREGRRCLRHHRLHDVATISEEVAFFAGDEGARPLRAALEKEQEALKREWQALSTDAAAAGDRAGIHRFERLLEEVDELETAGTADPR